MSSHSKDCKYTLEKNELVVGMQTFNNILQVYSISRGSNCFFSRKIAISNLYLQMVSVTSFVSTGNEIL